MLLLAVAGGAIAAALLSFVRPDLVDRLPRYVVPAAAVAGAVVLALADTAPTGWEPFDLALRAGFGALVPVAAARAGTVATAWLTVIATAVLLVAVHSPVPGFAGVAAGAFIAFAAAGLARPELAAVVAAAAIGPMAYAEWPLATGTSAAGMAAATVPVLLVGLARTGRPARGRIVAALALAIVFAGLGSVAGLAAALSARSDVDAAIELAEAGIDDLGDDDERAQERLRTAANHFDDAADTLRAWWARPALAVPGVAQQSRAVSTMASAGAELTRTAADASEDADIDSVRPRDGQVDLDALAALAEPIDRSVQALRRADTRLADVRSSLLVTPVADRLADLRTQVGDALGSAELAAHGVAVAPDMLGANGPRRYFIAFQNPAELTGNGGFMGNWAELVTDGGRLELTRTGRARDLREQGNPETRQIDGEPEYVSIYGQGPAKFWGNINFSPDHPTVSRVYADLYPESGGAPLDGVIALTPRAFAGFLELTGPVDVPGYPDQLTSENVERIMLHEQYLVFADQRGEDREAFLSEAVETLFTELTSGDLPGPSVLAEELGPAVDGRHLQMWSAHPEEQALFTRLGADGDVSRSSVDSFGVVTQNHNGNKIDWFLHREVDYEASWDPDTGEVSGTVTARITNQAPAAGLPQSVIGWGGDESLGQTPVDDGESLMQVVVYATFPFTSITVDGESFGHNLRTELGHETARLNMFVQPGETRVVVAEFSGQAAPGTRYTVRPLRQPTVNPDRIDISLSVADGWEVEAVDGGEARASVAQRSAEATERVEMTVEVDRSGSSTVLDRLRGID